MKFDEASCTYTMRQIGFSTVPDGYANQNVVWWEGTKVGGADQHGVYNRSGGVNGQLQVSI